MTNRNVKRLQVGVLLIIIGHIARVSNTINYSTAFTDPVSESSRSPMLFVSRSLCIPTSKLFSLLSVHLLTSPYTPISLSSEPLILYQIIYRKINLRSTYQHSHWAHTFLLHYVGCFSLFRLLVLLISMFTRFLCFTRFLSLFMFFLRFLLTITEIPSLSSSITLGPNITMNIIPCYFISFSFLLVYTRTQISVSTFCLKKCQFWNRILANFYLIPIRYMQYLSYNFLSICHRCLVPISI